MGKDVAMLVLGKTFQLLVWESQPKLIETRANQKMFKT